jgi:hypothetical protein
MAMFDFAIKVLFFIWAAQLILLGWLLLRRTVKRGLRSFPDVGRHVSEEGRSSAAICGGSRQ